MDRNDDTVKRIVVLILITFTSALIWHIPAGAQEVSKSSKTFGLKVTPLEYRANLKLGEDKKGHIDVSNPTNETLTVTTSVRAFRQMDDSGQLEFIPNEQITAGVKLDLDSFELPPRSALRMYFLLKGDRLPAGDVFASIFFTTKQQAVDTLAVNSAVRVGTLLSIVNKTPGAREAEITQLSVAPIQWGAVSGSYRIKNTSPSGSATGFYPEVNQSLRPFGQTTTTTASLLFAGRERPNNFRLSGFGGLYQVVVGYKDSQKTAYILVLTPLFLAIVVASLLVLIGIVTLIVRRMRRSRSRRRARQKR